MDKKLFFAPLILSSSSGNPTVIGQGSGQGTGMPQGMSWEEWSKEIAWGLIDVKVEDGANPDADYNGDGVVNRADYDYYIENELYNG